MTIQDFFDVLQIKEEYEIQGKLMEIMLSENKDNFLDKLIAKGFDVQKDEIRNIFENELANRKTLKQDYTPDCLCELVSKLCGEQKQLLDVCCGVGSLTIKNITCGNTRFFMEEISTMSISLLLLNMSIRNCNAIIYRKDVLTQKIYEAYELKAQEKYSSITILANENVLVKHDCIISNPPYSLNWQPFNDERFLNYGLAPKSKADYAFILDILYRLNDGGKAFIILPHGVLFRGGPEGKIRKALIHDNVIDCIIGLPSKLFLNTDIPVIILGLKKNRNNRNVLFIDASNKFEKQGKQNIMLNEHITKIVETYKNREDIDKYSKNVNFEEIERNDFNLNIPRYIDNFEEPEPIDIGQTIEEIVELENQIHDIDLELAKMFGELQGPQDYEVEKAKIIDHLTNRYIHDVSNAMNRIFTFISTEKQLANYKERELLDLVDIERSKKNKIYSKGSILIQLSATRGQMEYLEKDSIVNSKYGVMKLKNNNINSKYLYYILTTNMGNFLRIYQTGLNIVPDVFKYMKLNIHNDRNIQDQIQTMFDEVEKIEKKYQEDIKNWQNIKKYHLKNMFI